MPTGRKRDERCHRRFPSKRRVPVLGARRGGRNALFRRVELAARRRYADLADLDPNWTAQRWEEALAPYFAEHDSMGTGRSARSAALLELAEGDRQWTARQILEDPAGFHEWAIVATIDLASSVEAGEAVVHLTGVERL